MVASDGKKYRTNAATMEGIFRIIQSVTSPKVEPLKAWLAKVGSERIEETIDPEKAIDRAFATYLKKGYDEDWINQRLLRLSASAKSLQTNGRSVAYRREKSLLS